MTDCSGTGSDADGFTFVARKKRGSRPRFSEKKSGGKRKGNLEVVQSTKESSNIDKVAIEKKIFLAREELQISDFYRSFQESLFAALNEKRSSAVEKDSGNITVVNQQKASYSSSEAKAPGNYNKNLQDTPNGGTDLNSKTAEDGPCGIRTEHDDDPCSARQDSSKIDSKSSEDDFVGNQRDEVTEIKGPARDGVVSGSVHTVVCYGLGNFTDCAIARYQLALLLLICEGLKIKSSECHVYDPRFTAEEMQILSSLGLDIIPQNEECKRVASEPTLFYMPHCGKPLYNNLLWANWSVEGLAGITIIGNSFKNIQERLPSRVLQDFRYLQQIAPHVREFPIKSNFRFMDIFNDTSIHVFPQERLREVPCAFWDSQDKPHYDLDAATEIILCKDGPP
ncbi:SRR1-like protein [Acanthaster planci]|uniref:SRR1-like protein n=1 Tax=Acanthaster planci TaxID=133434 RepID=A0A8B7YJ54_ACAPL|nr:SRR1-like protein [Acanthaster planci]